MSNFKLNLGTYGHNLLAYEHDARGCKFAPVCKFAPGANLHPGANCAYEQENLSNAEIVNFVGY